MDLSGDMINVGLEQFALRPKESIIVDMQDIPGECATLQENVPYVKVHRYNPKHLYPKLNGYGDNGERFESMTAVTHLLITKLILKLAGICGFCNFNICT